MRPWTGVSPRAMALTTQCLVEQRIPDLPPACGPNCRYKVSVPSFVFQCTPNPSLLPNDQAGMPGPCLPESLGTVPDQGSYVCNGLYNVTMWNGTTDPTSMWAFYVAWDSGNLEGQDLIGTSGNASCSPVQAQYDVEVRTIALSTQILADFFFQMLTQGSDKKWCSICYHKHHTNDFSHPRRYEFSVNHRELCQEHKFGLFLAAACISFLCNADTLPRQFNQGKPAIAGGRHAEYRRQQESSESAFLFGYNWLEFYLGGCIKGD